MDRGTLFCTSCGTVSVVEGDCPQCSKPLKRLGRIGTIPNESKRETPSIIPMFKPSFPPSPRLADPQHSPRPAGQSSVVPMLITPKRLQLPAISSEPTEPTSPASSESPTLSRRAVDQPTTPPENGDDITPPSLSQPPTTPRSYFARLSQVFTWKNKSGDKSHGDQKQKDKEQKALDEKSSDPPVSSMTSSSSLPNLALAGVEDPDRRSPSPSKGIRVLPPMPESRTLRRRSLSGASATDNPFKSPPQFASSSNLKKDPSKSSIRPTTLELEADFVKIETEKLAVKRQSPAKTVAPTISRDSSLNSITEISSTTPDIKSNSSISASSDTTPTKKTKNPKGSKLTINVSNLNTTNSSESPSFSSSPPFNLFKNKSSINISVASMSNMNKVPKLSLPTEPFITPPAARTLPTPKARPLPSPPVLSPPNPFPTVQSPNIVSPRGHTPPSRPLPALPPLSSSPTSSPLSSSPLPSPLPPVATVKEQSPTHPGMYRRNTVHSDMHSAVKPSYTEQSRKEIPSEWLAFAQNQMYLQFRNNQREKLTRTEISQRLAKRVPRHPKIVKSHYFVPNQLNIPPPSQITSDEMREKVAQELINTEYEYVNDLYTLVGAKLEMEKFIHKNELSSIFNNIDQIYKVNEAMYRKLLSHLQPKRRPSLVAVEGLAPTESAFTPSVDDKVNAISRTFLGLSHTLKIYVKYSLGHQRAYDKLKILMETDEYGGMLKEIESMPGFKSTEMTGFLIKPVQRICRYPLLIKEILKSTPAEHTTLDELQEALRCVEETIQEINEAQRSIEREHNLMRAQQDLRLLGMDIDVISPTRMLVLDGPMRLVPVIRKTGGNKVSKKPKQGHYFLFDDFFLFVMESKKKETPHIFIPADQTLVTDPGDNALEIVHSGQQVWMFVLPSYHDKVFLLQKLSQIIEDNLQEARNRNGGMDKSTKSTLNIATLTRSGTLKGKKKQAKKEGKIVSELFGI